jgi:ppGpp synthetase/RelA/SpoT-type nucleotidyltranferase
VTAWLVVLPEYGAHGTGLTATVTATTAHNQPIGLTATTAHGDVEGPELGLSLTDTEAVGGSSRPVTLANAPVTRRGLLRGRRWFHHNPTASATVTAMPLSISGRQMNKLGMRLASPGPIGDDDYTLLAQVANDYQVVLDQVEAKLRGLGLQATTRVKTTSTLIDKLRRQPELQLNTIRDIAGARIVIDGGRWEQDQVTDRIIEAFASCPRAPRLIDRRKAPSHGYRAVHVVVFEDGIPVEIQIRTKIQDTWAQITEKLGDAWGRGLRYGLGPDQPDLLVDPANPDSVTRGKVIETLVTLSQNIDQIEDAEYQIAKISVPLAGHKNTAQTLMDKLLDSVSKLGGAT